MHTFALKLGLVLAAEKSKTPFYIAGGILVAWALFISLGIGMRKPDFPSSLGQQRAVMAISAVLVLITVSMAVVVSGGDSGATATASKPAAPGEAPPASSGTPTATTGTPTPSSSPAVGSVVALEANSQGQLSYNTTRLAAKAGVVTIELSNSSPIEHNVSLARGEKALGQTPIFTGGKKKLTLKLTPGSYTFYCSVPGHRQAGMEGVLTVTS
jgi:uncharacterized cupredoxin-like copper-binding protein